MTALFALMLPAAALGVAVSFQAWASVGATDRGRNVAPTSEEEAS